MKYLILPLLLWAALFWGQEVRPTYYEGGINSPWSAGIDYDLGFARFLSFNVSLLGGAASQVNRAASFGDVYFGETQFALRFYLNKADTWSGTYLSFAGRVGIYDMPVRFQNDPIIVERLQAVQLGFGIYLGYRWNRPLVRNMKDFPFTMAFEPYMGYSFDGFLPLGGGFARADRFTVGLRFTLGFYTHRYRPGTTVTNEETGEITRKSDAAENSNNAASITNSGVDATNGAPPNAISFFLRSRDPWDYYIL